MDNKERMDKIDNELREIKYDIKELVHQFKKFSIIYSELNIKGQVAYNEQIKQEKIWMYNLYVESKTKREFIETCLRNGYSKKTIEMYYDTFINMTYE